LFVVLGAGAWGTALASRVASNGHPTLLWGRDSAALKALDETGVHEPYLPGVQLPSELATEASFEVAVKSASDIMLGTPTSAFTEMLGAIREVRPDLPPIVWTCKGFEHGSGRILSSLVPQAYGEDALFAVLSGPTFAREVARGLPTAVAVAASTPDHAARLNSLLHCDEFRVYCSDDVIGLQVGGAVKNVLAIAVGISDGLGFGANARAALITRGLSEMMRLGEALGARRETLMGLAGLGDLTLSCTDDQSRNRRFGLTVGGGASVAEVERTFGQLVEGARCASEVMRIAERLDLDLPIMAQVAAVISARATPRDAVRTLMSRAPGQET
jgi:glycerol-3-phosphate dehydrogenase (NAD(P)+)